MVRDVVFQRCVTETRSSDVHVFMQQRTVAGCIVRHGDHWTGRIARCANALYIQASRGIDESMMRHVDTQAKMP